MDWIKCSERLPDEEKLYLVIRNEVMYIMHFEFNGAWDNNKSPSFVDHECIPWECTHWMPLPNPPED